MSFLSFLGFGKMIKDGAEVLEFPKPKAVPKIPEVQPPALKEKDPVTFYRLGLTNNNRISFQMGYTEITMSAAGCQQMIDQLTFFQSQLYDEDSGPTDDPDGGESVPMPEQKAA
jgi:hypothetical protein